MRLRSLVLPLAAMLISSPALAAIVVDGNLDAAYGAPKSTVTYDASTPSGNFGSPTSTTNGAQYDIYLTSDANYVYGFLTATGPGTSAGSFANLYFDLDPANNNGSDLGFEITNDRAFVPGMPGYSAALAGLTYVINGNNIEFSIDNSLFTSQIPGLTYYPDTVMPTIGSVINLRLCQCFSYSVAGGASYGNDRLGAVTLGGSAPAVPEPATWALMMLGFGGIGMALRRGRKDIRLPQLA